MGGKSWIDSLQVFGIKGYQYNFAAPTLLRNMYCKIYIYIIILVTPRSHPHIKHIFTAIFAHLLPRVPIILAMNFLTFYQWLCLFEGLTYSAGRTPTMSRTLRAMRLCRFQCSTATATISPPTNSMLVSFRYCIHT